jgi:hypothetical protein
MRGIEAAEARDAVFERQGELIMRFGNIPSGTYLVRLQTNAGESLSQQIVVIR